MRIKLIQNRNSWDQAYSFIYDDMTLSYIDIDPSNNKHDCSSPLESLDKLLEKKECMEFREAVRWSIKCIQMWSIKLNKAAQKINPGIRVIKEECRPSAFSIYGS